MRDLIHIVEKYSEENTALLRHLHFWDLDYYRYWWEICQWAERSDNLDEFSKATGEDIETADQLHEFDADIFEQIPEHLQKEAQEYVLHYLGMHDPAELPSNSFFTPKPKLIPRGTWLVHFTDEPDAIMSQGFVKGTWDMDRLGLTTYWNNETKTEGYNFAFEATSRYALSAVRARKYGRDCIMFQNSGVKAWHNSDEEDQIIFWGPEVDKRSLILLRRGTGGEWSVLARDQRKLFTSEFETAVQWVIENHQQYSHQLFGR